MSSFARSCRAVSLALPIAALALAGAAAAADPPDLTGTWSLEKRRSDNPARPRTEESKKKGGSGAAKQVARGISVFGIPVGSLPLPSKREPEPLAVDDLAGAEQLMSEVLQIRILQEPGAVEFDYGGAMSATYELGARARDGERTVVASWNHDMLEVVRELDHDARVTETYLLDGAGDLVWTVRLEQKRAEPRVIERIFTRARSGASTAPSTQARLRP
jgi:hypothetical protein